MFELLTESIALHNLPVTLLLGLVVFYWLLVLLGVMDSDSEPMDLDGDGIADVSGGASGFWPTCGRFLYLGEVPLVVVGSFLAVSLWVLSVLGNYYFNGEPGNRSAWVAVLLLVPNLAVSLVITRIAATPFRQLFSVLDDSATEVESVLGREGLVSSTQVDERYGQVSIGTSAAPLLINARVTQGNGPLPKGTPVRVSAAGPDGAFYFVQPVICRETQSPKPSPAILS